MSHVASLAKVDRKKIHKTIMKMFDWKTSTHFKKNEASRNTFHEKYLDVTRRVMNEINIHCKHKGVTEADNIFGYILENITYYADHSGKELDANDLEVIDICYRAGMDQYEDPNVIHRNNIFSFDEEKGKRNGTHN